MRRVGVDILTVIVELSQDPRPIAAVCSVWAAAVAVHGKRLMDPQAPPPASQIADDSLARGLYYLSTGHASPHPGDFACSADATQPIWPFPVPTIWRELLRQTYRRFPTQRDIGKCDVYRYDGHRLGSVRVETVAKRDKPEGSLGFATIKANTGIYRQLLKLANHRVLGDIFAIGPCFVSLAEKIVLVSPESRSLVAVDAAGAPLDDHSNHWNQGHLSSWKPIQAPILRRVSPTCVAILARIDDLSTATAFAYCAGVIWWHKQRGLRVRHFDLPARPSTTAGWSLPPVDARRADLPVCVLNWGSEWPYPDIKATRATQEKRPWKLCRIF